MHNLICADFKGELASITQGLTRNRKFKIYWNPCGLHGFVRHRVNPCDHLRIESPSLVADTKVFCNNVLPLSGSGSAQYFEQRARGEFLEAIALTLVRLRGVLTLPDLYEAINLIPAGGQGWLDFAFEMQESGFAVSKRIEEEIANARADSSGGYQGILGELFKAFSCLSDPQLLASVSPPYDFSFEDLCRPDQLYNVYLMCPAEYIEGWAPVIRSMFVAAMIYKSRAPQAPRQTWILDECAALASGGAGSKGGGFPLVAYLFTYGAGVGIRPVAVFQSAAQMDAIVPEGESIITSSAGVRSYFAVRDLRSATTLSNMLGAQTLVYDDELQQARARHARDQALNRMFDGDEPFGAMLEYAHQSSAAQMQSKQHRLLRTPAEILSLPPNKQIIFADGVSKPFDADRSAYYEQRFMAGRFYPNRFYPPLDRVRVKTLLGHAWLNVIDEPVPAEFASLPQYSNGRWTRLEQRKWWQ